MSNASTRYTQLEMDWRTMFSALTTQAGTLTIEDWQHITDASLRVARHTVTNRIFDEAIRTQDKMTRDFAQGVSQNVLKRTCQLYVRDVSRNCIWAANKDDLTKWWLTASYGEYQTSEEWSQGIQGALRVGRTLQLGDNPAYGQQLVEIRKVVEEIISHNDTVLSIEIREKVREMMTKIEGMCVDRIGAAEFDYHWSQAAERHHTTG